MSIGIRAPSSTGRRRKFEQRMRRAAVVALRELYLELDDHDAADIVGSMPDFANFMNAIGVEEGEKWKYRCPRCRHPKARAGACILCNPTT